MTWTDVHTHLQMLEMTPEEAIKESAKNSVERFITIGTDPVDWQFVLEAVEKYKPKVFGTLGNHPHDVEKWNDEADAFLLKNLDHPRIVAVGEIGLDYYYDNAPRELQLKIFRRQMEIAALKKMPVEIHTRDAEEDTAKILKEFDGRVVGMLHCFTSSQYMADAALDLGYHISISGVVTFKNADSLRETVKTIPLDRLHVETDSPFLAPVPQRGKKNFPGFMIHTAEKVAELKGISLEELSKAVKANAERLFPRLLMG